MDTHALSEPALTSAIEVLAANEVIVCLQPGLRYTPTPAISHAILKYNRNREEGFANGIVITPSHNPPEDGGIFKYNPPHGGPAGSDLTGIIEDEANRILAEGLKEVRRISYRKALDADTTREYDFIQPYVEDLETIVDLKSIADSGLSIGVDPLGGAAVDFWDPIADRYRLNIEVVNRQVDPTFSFMTLDKDGMVWTTDKDGIVMGLMACEIMAKTGNDPAQIYEELENRFGRAFYTRLDIPASPEQKEALKKLTPDAIETKELAGEQIRSVLTHAPGNNSAIGGLKIVTENGWFAVRPSGTENINKMYAESFKGEKHLETIQAEAENIAVNA